MATKKQEMEGEPLQARIVGWILALIGLVTFACGLWNAFAEERANGTLVVGLTIILIGVVLWILSGIWHALERIAEKGGPIESRTVTRPPVRLDM